MAQVVVHPISKQEVRGSIRFLSRYQWKFSKYFNQGSGGSKPTLKCRSHHKEVSDLQGRGSMSLVKLLGGFLGDFERYVYTDSGRLSKPIKERDYNTYNFLKNRKFWKHSEKLNCKFAYP